jgi:hypothetical protein
MSADRFAQEEERLQAYADAELETLPLVDGATNVLVWVLEQAGFEGSDDDPPLASYWRARALLYIGALAIRALRCAAILISSGYEPEALVFKRTLSEALARAQRVHRDKSGEYARQWLQGRAGK